jgi:diguanylate cyclase (GGDEF)-like protein
VRERLAAAGSRIQQLTERTEIAAATAEDAVPLVGADSVAVIVRSLEGPSVVWQHPGGAERSELWGPRTLSALMSHSAPVRLAVPGDPLAGGAKTSLLTAPVAVGGQLFGTLVARRRNARSFSAADEDALARLALISGAAMHAGSRGSQDHTRGRDGVTGLANAEMLRLDVMAAVKSAPRHGMPTALAMLEVDGLARLRTEQGTEAADHALALIAATIEAELRVGDLAYRFSADEIAVIMPGTEVKAATVIGERVSAAAVQALSHRVPSPSSPPLRLRVVVLPVEGTADDVILRAIRAMGAARVKERWQDKRSG